MSLLAGIHRTVRVVLPSRFQWRSMSLVADRNTRPRNAHPIIPYLAAIVPQSPIGIMCRCTTLPTRIPAVFLRSYTSSPADASAYQPKSTNELIERGRYYQLQGQFQQALQHYDAVIARDPTVVSAYFAKGECMMSLNRFAEAKELFNQVIKFLPQYGLAYSNRAMCTFRLGDIDTALRELDWLIYYDPDLVDGYLMRAQVYVTKGQYPAALADFRKCYQLDPFNHKVMLQIAQLLCVTGQMKEAFDLYDKVLVADSNNLTAKEGMAAVCAAMNKHDWAVELLTDLISNSDMSCDPLYCKRAMSQLALGHIEDAIQDADKALSLNPTQRFAHFIRAQARKEIGQYEEAISDLSNFISLCKSVSAANTEFSSLVQEESQQHLHEALSLREELVQLVLQRNNTDPNHTSKPKGDPQIP